MCIRVRVDVRLTCERHDVPLARDLDRVTERKTSVQAMLSDLTLDSSGSLDL